MLENKKIAFITESTFSGKYPRNFSNARTEIAWQIVLNSDHYHFSRLDMVANYDHVFVIIPKGRVYLDACGIKLSNDVNPITNLLSVDFVSYLKTKNSKVHFIQEGPTSWILDYSVTDQFHWYNLVSRFDSIFCHNEFDKSFYEGMFPGKTVNVLPSLMITDLINGIIPDTQNKVMIGGNFSKFYGGFCSYIVSQEFSDCLKYTMDSHSKRDDEQSVEDLNHLPRLSWLDWMKELSTFKFAVHLMPTVAAGTFSLNCAYFGVPCIGNKKMDTQRILFPELSVDVENISESRRLALKLNLDAEYYKHISEYSREEYTNGFSELNFIRNISKVL